MTAPARHPQTPNSSAKRKRPLVRVPVPAGPAGVTALEQPIRAALDGTGPAIVPVPLVGLTVSTQFVQRVLDATRPDDPDAPLEDDAIAVVVPTSGSTGQPRGVLHTAASLQALSDAVNAGQPQWIAALPLTSIGGLNVVLRAWHCGIPPIALPSIGGAAAFTPKAFAEAVQVACQRSDDVRVSLVAAQVRRLLGDDQGTAALVACRQVLVGGGPLPATVAQAAHDAGVAVIRTYGSTETAGGCVFDGQPLTGVRMQVRDGEVVLDGPMLARGYRLQPQLTRERFTAVGYRTGDLGRIIDGSLAILGRMDDVVIIGGVNVAVGAVETTIADMPGIASAVVVAIDGASGEPELRVVAVLRDAATGHRVAAASVDLHAERSQVDRIRQAVHEALGPNAVPRRIAFVPALPLLPNGKTDRQAIANQAASSKGYPWQP